MALIEGGGSVGGDNRVLYIPSLERGHYLDLDVSSICCPPLVITSWEGEGIGDIGFYNFFSKSICHSLHYYLPSLVMSQHVRIGDVEVVKYCDYSNINDHWTSGRQAKIMLNFIQRCQLSLLVQGVTRFTIKYLFVLAV